jgi:molybdate transport system substrate-binding protein
MRESRSTAVTLVVCLLLAGVVIQGCGRASRSFEAGQPPQAVGEATLTVFAAASLTEAFTELGQQFEADHPGVKVAFNFAGSQALSAQLGEGAPADLFASASTNEMNNAVAAGRVADGSQRTFARNKLVVIYPMSNPAGLKKLQDLAKPGLKLVLAAEEVPAGKYSLEFLDNASQDSALGVMFRDDVLKNVVSYEENVKAVFTKVVLGEGDAGIVYLTDINVDDADGVGRLEIPDALNVTATYPIAEVSDAQQPELARAYIELVLSAQGQAILARYGFLAAD